MSTLSTGNVAEIRGCATCPHHSDSAAIQHRLARLRGDQRTVATAVALGIMSSGLLAQIATVSDYVPRGHSCESRYMAGGIA